MKKKIFKSLAVVACALLLVVGSVVGTFAYLTSQAEVTNTFTVGNVKITMDETDVDGSTSGTPGTGRDIENAYKLFPGQTYTKDPIIKVDANSEDCWLFVEITDELENIQDADTIKTQLAAKGWTLVSGETNVYGRATANKASDEVEVFEYVKIKSTVTNDELDDFAGKTVSVIAYAVQAEGFSSANAAWTAAKPELKS